MIKKNVVNKLTNKEGFTLIELLVALTIFAIGILALAQLQASAIVYNSEARRYTEATIIAQSKIDELRSKAFIDVLYEPAVTIGGYEIETIVIDDTPLSGSKTVTVDIEWTHKGTKSYSLSTIIADK